LLRLCGKAFLTTTPTCRSLCRRGPFVREFDLDQRRGRRLLQAVARNGSRIMVTESGRPFVRLVAAAFDAYLPQNNKRHSVAV
jgi:coproporphyrinogen III oxidase-like Fe-S oxidoreductase